MSPSRHADYTTPVLQITRADCERLLDIALTEDAPAGDPTSEAIFSSEDSGTATIVAREPGVLCGTPVVHHLLNIMEEKTNYRLVEKSWIRDGQRFEAGDRLMEFSGSIRGILRAERIILNFLQYLSGISSVVHQAVEKAGSNLIIVDTRKTIPGYRKLVKYAVHAGGGSNHRINLSDMILIKDNHIAASGSVSAAIERSRVAHPELPLEIEIDHIDQLREALPLEPDYVLLDNMDREHIAECLELIAASASTRAPHVEISGGWNPDRFGELEGLGELRVSMSYITGQTRFLDLSMEIESSTR